MYFQTGERIKLKDYGHKLATFKFLAYILQT